MKDTDLELPYPYTENHRGGSTKFLVVSWALTITLLLLVFLGAPIPLAVAMAPASLMILRAALFDVIRNATHEAIRSAQADARLDQYIADGAFYARTHDMSKDELKKRFHDACEEADD